MLGHRMQQLFVKGEVLLDVASIQFDNLRICHVNITNDGWHVCRKTFTVSDVEDLERQFYEYLDTPEFQSKLRGQQSC